MDRFSSMTVDEIGGWLTEQEIATSVVESFKANEVDGDALVTLYHTTRGPDCLKELVPKVGIRMKVYKLIKLFCETDECEIVDVDCSKSKTSQVQERQKKFRPVYSCDSSPASQSEESHYKDKWRKSSASGSMNSRDSSPASFSDDKELMASQSQSEKKCKRPLKLSKHTMLDPFPIPVFRKATEENLKRCILTDADRKYMVQTLATVLMTKIERPTMTDCLQVSKALHKKFKFLGSDGSSENSWKWFIYTRTQNVNRPRSESDSELPRKKVKEESKGKHCYPVVPTNAEDETSNSRNLTLIKDELAKPDPCHDTLKLLMSRTFPIRRPSVLESGSVTKILEEYPLLKRSAYANLEFGLIMQRSEIKDEFDEDFIPWAKAVMLYCKQSCMKTTAIKTIVDATDFKLSCDDVFLTNSLRCLAILLTTSKIKKHEGDIPHLMRFVPDQTPPSEMPDHGNTQPHLVAIVHDDYNQYYVAVERNLCMECTDIPSALFFLIATHYIFNLSYHTKVHEVLRFIQEKILNIQSDGRNKSSKSPVAVSHISGIAGVYQSLNRDSTLETEHVSD